MLHQSHLVSKKALGDLSARGRDAAGRAGYAASAAEWRFVCATPPPWTPRGEHPAGATAYGYACFHPAGGEEDG